jgi:hypothetical protein
VGAAATLSTTTPSHRTDRPWNKVAREASTPRDAAFAHPQPEHPFESKNQFVSLRPTDDDASDDGSRRLTKLLTPGNLALREDDVPPGDTSPDAVGDVPALPADDAQARGSLSTEDLVRANTAGIAANTAGIAELRTLLHENMANTAGIAELRKLRALLHENMSTVAALLPMITSHGIKLGELAENVSKLQSNVNKLRTSITTPPDLPTLIDSALGPLKTSVDEAVALATTTAEEAI